MFEGFGGGGSPFDFSNNDKKESGFSSLFSSDSKEEKSDTLSSRYVTDNNSSNDNGMASSYNPFGISGGGSSGTGSMFDNEEPPFGFSSKSSNDITTSDPHSNDKGTSQFADLNAREANYGNLSVIDKMRGMQSNRLNMDGDITLAEQYADSSLDRRFGDGRHNVTMTDMYTDEHLYRAIKGLNTDGFIDDPAENAHIDIEGSGGMNLNDYKKNEDFDPFGTRAITNPLSSGIEEMNDLGITSRNKAVAGDLDPISMVHNQESEEREMVDYSKESELGKGGVNIVYDENKKAEGIGALNNRNNSIKDEEISGIGGAGKAVAEVIGGVAIMAAGSDKDEKNKNPDMKGDIPNMKGDVPSMKNGTPDMKAGVPNMKPDVQSGYTAGQNLPTNLKNIKKKDFYRLIKFDGRGNPIGPDGQPLNLSPSEKAALLKLKKKFEEEDAKPVVKKKKIDPLEELKQQTAERERVKAEMEAGEEGEIISEEEVDFDMTGVAAGAAGAATVVSKGDNDSGGKIEHNKKQKRKLSHSEVLQEMDQVIDPNSIFDETDVLKAKELGISLKEYQDYKNGKSDKPVSMMSFEETKKRIAALKNKLEETTEQKEKDYIQTDIDNLESNLLKKLTGLM